MGVWTETRTGSWSYDPNGHDDDQPATTALPVIYPATHKPSPRARIDPDLMPPEDQHRHGGPQ